MELYAFLFFVMASVHETRGARHVVYWDEKQIPKLANGGLEVTLEVDDYMDILCPLPENSGGLYHPNSIFLRLYNVTRQQYLECDTENAIRLQSCDDPEHEKKLTTKFQERSPYPFGFTFRAGETYYYLSKPLRGSRKGCAQNAMRMMVHVKRKGTVFDESDHERTRTYHVTSHVNRPKKDITIHHRPGHPKKSNRHHHEKATTTASTTPPKVIIQYETPRYNVPKTRMESVRDNDPENRAVASTRPAITTLICATALTLFLTCFWSRD